MHFFRSVIQFTFLLTVYSQLKINQNKKVSSFKRNFFILTLQRVDADGSPKAVGKELERKMWNLTEETTGPLPAEAVPTQSEAASITIVKDVRRPSATRGIVNRTECHDRELALDFGILLPKRQELSDLCWFESEIVYVEDDTHRALLLTIEMYKHELVLATGPHIREELGRDPAGYPVVVPSLDHFLESTILSDRHEVHCFWFFQDISY